MNNFNSKYYQWCREEASREAAAGFSSVAAVRGSLALKSVHALLGFSQPIRERVALALVARWHGHQPDPEQQRLLAAFDSARFSAEQPTVMSRREPADGKTLRSMLRQSTETLGKEVEAGSGSEMRCEYDFDTCKVITFVDLGGRSRQLEYHQLLWLQGDPRPIQKSINLMARLGLASVTTWDLVESGEEEDAVRLLRTSCGRFIEAIPHLV